MKTTLMLAALAACHATPARNGPMLTLRITAFFVEDIPNTLAFYDRAFGLRARFVHPSRGYAELDTGPTLLAFISDRFVADADLLHGRTYRANRRESDPVAAQIALITDDLPAAWTRALAAGAEVVKEPEHKPWGQTAGYMRDCNGVLVELATKSPRDP